VARSDKGRTATNHTRRQDGARPRRRNARPARGRFARRRISWSRRIGISAALLLLAGITIALASASLNDKPVRNAQTPSPSVGEPSLVAATPSATPDHQAPSIRVTEPTADQTIYTSSVMLRGRTEAGANLDVLDEASNEHLPVQVDPDGRFTATIPLEVGHNWLTLTSKDQAGNVGHERVDLVRTASAASIELLVDATKVDFASLPQQIPVSATITDDLGNPADGTPVTFSVSPPNAATITYATTSDHGHASWPDLTVNDDPQSVGQWLVTVLAQLPSGNELRGNASFKVG
jgi:hypothetical protein